MCETPTPGNAPKYLKNSATRADGTVDEYAYTRVDGRRISLGRYGDSEGYQRWKRLLNEWLAAHDLDQAIEPSRVTVADLADRWLDSERSRMDSARISRKTYAAACYAAEAAVLEHAGSLATTFGPKALKSVQARLVRTPCKTIRGRYRNAQKPPTLSRTEVNRRVNGIRQMFRWGVSEELVSPATLASLRSVSGLRAGEGRDNPARKPADPAAVRALAAELRARGHHGHASVLEILRWTGCRPEEVCSLTAADVRQTSTGLELHIRNHKTRKSTNADRIIPLNDRAASLMHDAITEHRNIDPDRRLFLSPRGRPFGSSRFYYLLRKTADAAGLDRVEPYGLRHLGATEAIEAGMSEAETAALLGHSPSSTIVRRYSQDRTALARRAANAIGGRDAI
ncbi:site-specific integrase [bacterium]|nr:site-specific integrase [bacterium]MDB4633015.1 site-specific integrase [bacterium]MDC0992055.1 site-specific integrase [bacterium]